jgi:hypothetical protein
VMVHSANGHRTRTGGNGGAPPDLYTNALASHSTDEPVFWIPGQRLTMVDVVSVSLSESYFLPEPPTTVTCSLVVWRGLRNQVTLCCPRSAQGSRSFSPGG